MSKDQKDNVLATFLSFSLIKRAVVKAPIFKHLGNNFFK